MKTGIRDTVSFSKVTMRANQAKSIHNEGKTRDEWLLEVAAAMARWFDDLGFPLAPLQIRSGFPSTGKRGRNTAESWANEDDGLYVIVVRPDRSDPIDIAAAMAHQMCRIASGSRDTHGHLFRHLAVSIGLRGKKTEAPPGVVFKELAAPIIDRAGSLPNPELEPASAPARPKQTTRQIKVACITCGYVARVSRKWLDDVGAPLCPQHGQMVPAD